MDIKTKKKLISYLTEYVTPNKLEKMGQVIPHRTRHTTVVLEDLFQPHNASAVLRSCDIFGVQNVHTVENRNVFKATKGVAMGASKWLTVQRHKTISACADMLKKDGYRIVAATPHADASTLYDLPLDNKCALIFGTEHEGLTESALDCADEYVKIPMYGFTESFNVSVSVALCLQHVMNTLRASDIPWQLSDEEKVDLQLTWIKNILRGSDGLIKKFLAEE